MSIPHLSLQDARHLQLAAQGLLTPRRGKARAADLLATIRRMALLQIDTISVVARSPYLVLFSRLGQYDPRWLEQLLADGDLRILGARGLLRAARGLPPAAPPHAGSRRHGLEVFGQLARHPSAGDWRDHRAHSPARPGAGGGF